MSFSELIGILKASSPSNAHVSDANANVVREHALQTLLKVSAGEVDFASLSLSDLTELASTLGDIFCNGAVQANFFCHRLQRFVFVWTVGIVYLQQFFVHSGF
jgi:hypothetical protein